MKHIIQRGDAHTVVIISLIAALICALGIAFYQNYVINQDRQDVSSSIVTRKEKINTETTKTPQPDVYTSYKKEGITLEYPTTWKVSTPADHQMNASGVVFTSPDYKEADQAGPPKQVSGARIFVIRHSPEEYQNTGKSLAGSVDFMKQHQMISNVSQIAMCGVDGKLAYSYEFTYEGPRYMSSQCEVLGSVLEVRYMYPDGKYETYSAQYKHVVETIKSE